MGGGGGLRMGRLFSRWLPAFFLLLFSLLSPAAPAPAPEAEAEARALFQLLQSIISTLSPTDWPNADDERPQQLYQIGASENDK